MSEKDELEGSQPTGDAGHVDVESSPTAANGSARKERQPMASRGAKWALLATLIVMALGAVKIWRYYATHVTTDDAQIDGDIYPISARVRGHVIAVEVENNQFVKKGDVLARLDPTDYQVALDRAAADYSSALANAQASRTGVPITSVSASSQVSSAQAQVNQAQAAIGGAEREYQAAQARVQQAQANSSKAQSDVSRFEQLIKKDEISRQQYDHALQTAQAEAAAVAGAQAASLAALESVAQARARLSQAQADFLASKTGPQRVLASRAHAEVAEAAVKMAKANLDQARLNVKYTTILAPTDGIVGKKSIETGQNVEPGQALMAIVPVEGLYVTANFKETQLRHMRPGDPAVIHVDAYGRNYRGRVLNVAGATGERFSLLPPENATGNYVKVVQRIPVKIVFDKDQAPQHQLRVGLSVEPTVKVN